MEWQVSKVARPATGKRILLVEDEPQVLSLMQHVLLSAGYEVDAVATVGAAIDKLATRPYHLVVTDDRLPDGRGVQIADVAKAKSIDAVVITGYMFQATRTDLDRHEHLMKPMRPSELVEAVDQRLSKLAD